MYMSSWKCLRVKMSRRQLDLWVWMDFKEENKARGINVIVIKGDRCKKNKPSV